MKVISVFISASCVGRNAETNIIVDLVNDAMADATHHETNSITDTLKNLTNGMQVLT